MTSPMAEESKKKPCECNYCGKGFHSEAYLKSHERIHTGNPQFSCDVCGDKFYWKNSLNFHKKTHTNEEECRCEFCGRLSLTKESLRRHMLTHMKKKIPCERCGLKFRNKRHLQVHMTVHTGKTPHQCQDCPKTFALKLSLNIHMKTHLAKRAYQCKICTKTFITNYGLNYHVRGTHLDTRPYSCIGCGKCFKQSSALSKHRRQVHLNKKPYSCDVCQLKFVTKDRLGRHKTVHTGERPFECAICSRRFRTRGNLKGHIASHMDLADRESVYKCHICAKTLTQRSSLKQHIQTVHEGVKAFKCDPCGMYFSQSSGLRTHQRHFHGDKVATFRCTICDKIFGWKGSLVMHMRKHTEDISVECDLCHKKIINARDMPHHMLCFHQERTKDSICEICGLAFYDVKTMSNHIKSVHSTERPFECKTCFKRFKNKFALRDHTQMKHSDEKPFQCHLCLKRFPIKNCLAQHLKRHAGLTPNKCEDCGKGFLLKAGLKRHRLKNHTPGYVEEKPYVCERCGYRCALSGRLKAHKEAMHSKDKDKRVKKTYKKRDKASVKHPQCRKDQVLKDNMCPNKNKSTMSSRGVEHAAFAKVITVTRESALTLRTRVPSSEALPGPIQKTVMRVQYDDEKLAYLQPRVVLRDILYMNGVGSAVPSNIRRMSSDLESLETIRKLDERHFEKSICDNEVEEGLEEETDTEYEDKSKSQVNETWRTESTCTITELDIEESTRKDIEEESEGNDSQHDRSETGQDIEEEEILVVVCVEDLDNCNDNEDSVGFSDDEVSEDEYSVKSTCSSPRAPPYKGREQEEINYSTDDEGIHNDPFDEEDSGHCAALICSNPQSDMTLQCSRCDDSFHSQCVMQDGSSSCLLKYHCFRCIEELGSENPSLIFSRHTTESLSENV